MERFRYFQTLVQIGSMREASELLHISQPALSKAIKKLEGEWGIKLTVPSGRGIEITTAGREISQRLGPVLEELNNIISDPNAKAASPRLRIGSFEVFTTHYLGPIIETHFSGMPVEVHELIPGKMEEALSQGAIDVGITYLPIPQPGLEFIKVTEVEMGVFGRKDKFAEVPFERLPFVAPIMPISSTPSKVRGLDGWPDDRVPRKIVYRVTLMETALEFCRRGLAVAYLPKPVVTLHNATVQKGKVLEELLSPKLPSATKRQGVFLIKRKSDLESPFFKTLGRAIRASSL